MRVLVVHHLSEQHRRRDFTQVHSEVLTTGVEVRDFQSFHSIITRSARLPHGLLSSSRFRSVPMGSIKYKHFQMSRQSPIIHYFASHMILVNLT